MSAATGTELCKFVQERCKRIIESSERKPKLCVIDLDYTLWPCYCECTWDTPRTYPEAVPLLDSIQDASIPIAVASRSPTPHIARRYLHELGLFDRFVGFEVYPSSTGKDKHLNALSQATGVDHADMIFFDGSAFLLLVDHTCLPAGQAARAMAASWQNKPPGQNICASDNRSRERDHATMSVTIKTSGMFVRMDIFNNPSGDTSPSRSR